jgi:Tol biopolymer transport system component/DNA-binding winged helix-turn-helix (wHTH) protein
VSAGHETSYRFAAFEVDFRTFELRKHGLKIKLQEKPIRILQALLERPGMLVTRAELRQRLWPKDIYVDFERNLTSAMNKLRAALNDSAEKPRYIETLPRRGYRFIAPISVGGEIPHSVTVLGSGGNGAPAGPLEAPPLQLRSAAEHSPETTRGVRESVTGFGPNGDGASTGAHKAIQVETTIAAGEQARAPSQHNEARQAAKKHLPRAAFLVTAAVLVVVALAYWLRPGFPLPRILSTAQITNDARMKPASFGLPMATDGARLYFSEVINGHWTPVAVSATGGETVPIPSPFEDAMVLDVSPDGTELVVASVATYPEGEEGGPLWVMPIMGGAPRPLGNLAAMEAAWSPDGSKMLYTRLDDRHLYVANADGTNSHTLVEVPGQPYGLGWSPDGERISVSVYDNGSCTLWEVSAAGTGLHRLLATWNGSAEAERGRWTRDGKYFLFGSSGQVWVVREKTGLFEKANRLPLQLTAGTALTGQPLPSKDGKRIFVPNEQITAELLRFDRRSEEWLPYLSGTSAYQTNFSRDGKWVAYTTFPLSSLFRSKVDGGEKLQLTSSPMLVKWPSWSPDGSRISFVGRAPNEPWRIYLVTADGGNLERLTVNEVYKSAAGWSPDGNWLVFSTRKQPVETRASAAIHLLNVRTRQVSTLPDSEGYYAPLWSPDGRYIAAQKDPDNLMLFDLATWKWQELTKAAVGVQTWSRDGKYLYFSAFGKDQACLRIRISDRKLERVASFKSLHNPNWWMGLAPDDSPLMVSEVGILEIYALDWETP